MFLRFFKAAILLATAKKFQKRLPLIFVLISSLFLTLTAQAAPGDLDTSFGNGGKVITSFGGNCNLSNSKLQPDGKIVTAGQYEINSLCLARYNSDGSLDSSFGNGGKTITNLNSSLLVAEIALYPDGKIIVVGHIQVGIFLDYMVVRYNSNGSLDTAFGSNGVVITSITPNSDSASSAKLQPDGKIVVGGNSRITTSDNDFVVARFNIDGTLDSGFGTGGKVITPIIGNSDFAYALALQADGRILQSGGAGISFQNGHFATVRYNTDGSLDTGFGVGGKVITPFGDEDAIGDVVVQADGKIVVVGQNYISSTGSSDFALARYNTNGSLDSTFGNGGIVTTAIVTTIHFSNSRSAAIQPDGKIVVGGSINLTGTLGTYDFASLRYNTNGTIDSSFGSNGIVTTDFGINDSVRSIALQSDGKIVVAGRATISGSPANTTVFALARYHGTAQNRLTQFDFDGDGESDISVFRPSNGAWYLLQSQNGFTGVTFGNSTDRIVPADYDGDGKTDVAVYRNGTWYLQRSSAGFLGTAFGDANDIPQPADFDGDGKSEIAVFRPSNGTWYIYNLVNNQFTALQFGQAGDVPAAADYDGDGKADVAVFRSGVWYLQRSRDGFTGIAFGQAGDKPVSADYDGDGKADVAVFRPSNGNWYLLQSTAGFTGLQFGLGTDLPVPADYDGDGKSDIAVFRNGTWYLKRSQAGFTGVAFGTNEDKPVPNAFIP